jgi:hypothetical protein
MRPRHQAMARIALLVLIGVPNNSPRSVSMTGVKGQYSANQRIQHAIVSGRTNALPVNARSWKLRERLLAPACYHEKRLIVLLVRRGFDSDVKRFCFSLHRTFCFSSRNAVGLPLLLLALLPGSR